jgi:metal-responsive CopG/Arc/MetJ family transcriptional regulator
MATKSAKRTISFSEDTFETLDELVPRSKRSRFIDRAVIKELQQVAKQQALDVLQNTKKFDVTADSIVETIRKIRKEEFQRLDRKQ